MLLGLAACNDATDPDKQRIIGQIDAYRTSPPALVAPAEVRMNERFTVTVTTFGSSGCTTPDGGSVVVDGDLVRILPYDIVPMAGHNDVCPRDFTPFPRLLPVKLSVPGAVRVRVVGRRPSGDHAGLDSVEAAVTVIP
jgi:hypothetical protein